MEHFKMTKEFIGDLGETAKGLSLVVERLNHKKDGFKWQPNVRQHAASLIKVPIMLALLVEATAGKVNLDASIILKSSDQVGGCGTLQLMNPNKPYTLLELMRLMICISDNTATNMLIDYLGKETINQTLASFGLRDTQVARKLMVGDFSIFSTTSAEEICYCLYLLAHSDKLSPQMRTLALETLANQQYNDRLSAYWGDVPFLHKTGEITGVIHDAGILAVNGEDFVIAALFKDLDKNTDGIRWIQNLGLCIKQDLETWAKGGSEA